MVKSWSLALGRGGQWSEAFGMVAGRGRSDSEEFPYSDKPMVIDYREEIQGAHCEKIFGHDGSL